MVADTRSAWKMRNEADGHSSKGSSREIESVGVRRSTRGTPSKSRQPVEELSLLNSKRRKEKTVIQVTMESKKTEIESEEGGSLKRKRMTARAYLAKFKRQSLRKNGSDVVELEQARRSLHVSGHKVDLMAISEDVSNNCGEMNLCHGREECTDNASGGSHPELINDSNNPAPDISSDNIHVDANVVDTIIGGTLDANSLDVSTNPSTHEGKSNDGNKCGEKILGYSREKRIDKASSGIILGLISGPKDCSPDKPNDNVNLDPNLLDTDIDGTLDGSRKIEMSNDCNNHGEMILGSAREEYTDKASSRALAELISGPKDHSPAIPSIDDNLDANLLDTVVDETLDGDGVDRSCNPYMQGLISPQSGDNKMHPREAISDGGIANLLQTCPPCSENERVDDDSPNQEHCLSSQVGKEDVGSNRTIKDTGDTNAACSTEASKKCIPVDIGGGEDNHRNVCASCNKDGKLQYCNGKWQCTVCMKKKPLYEQQSKIIEYWVPAQLSHYQLELYCSTLLSNSLYLRSTSKNEPFGMLRELLFTLRKSCDHPYLLHSSIQGQLFTEMRSAGEILDAGIKASGKLLLLDMMLSEIQTRGLKALVLYQLTVDLTSLGSILEDFLRQRFGQHSYEHVDSGVIPSKKHAAVNRFNKKDSGLFVFLLESRACSSSIKSLELDIIITYNSDWNPANDLRTLQKLRIDSTAEQIKVFRLYSSCTVEEQALILAKKNLNIDSSFQTKNRATLDSLLGWGASYLFGKLDEHLSDKATSKSDFSFGALLPDEVIQEFQAIISGDQNTCSNSCISKAQMGVGRYITSIPFPGEAKGHLKDGEEPRVYWKNLLNRETPRWKYLTDPSPRNRKRVRYFDTSTDESGRKDTTPKQRKKVVEEVAQDAVSDGGSSTSQREGYSFSKNQTSMFEGNSCSTEGLAEERVVSGDEQKSLQLLRLETNRLCQTLKLSEVTAHATERFLEYVSKNHRTHSDIAAIMHALQISLCWIGASISKQKIDRRESLISAKQLLGYQCTEEQVSSVYRKMRSLKRRYMECSENICDSGRNCFSAEDISKEPPVTIEVGSIKILSLKEKSEEIEVGEATANDKNAETQSAKASRREMHEKIKETKKKCLKRMKKLELRQTKEIDEFSRIWEEKRRNLDEDYKLESAFIRSIHGQGSVGAEKLKVLGDNFAKKIAEHNLLKNLNLKKLEEQQLAARNEEQKKADSSIAELESYLNQLKSVNGPQFDSESEEDAGVSQLSRTRIPTIDPEPSASSHHLESHNESRSLSTRRNDDTNASTTEAHSCESPPKTSSNLPPHQLCTDKDNESLVEIPVSGLNEVVGSTQLVESAQAAVLPDCTELTPQQVLQDEVIKDLVSDEQQNLVASTLENNNTSPVPCSTPGIVESLNPVLPNFPLPTNDTHVAECSEQMHDVPVDVSSHRSLVTEVEQQNFDQGDQQNHDDQGRTSLPTMEADLIGIIVQDPISQRGESLGLHGSDHPVVESERRHRPAQDIELSSSSPLISAAVPRAVGSTSVFQNQNIHPLSINAGYFRGRNNSFLAPPPPQVNNQGAGRPNVPDPLQYALEQMQKEVESIKKKREDKVAELQSNRDKEIQDIIKKYEQNLQEVEVEYNLKKNEHNANMEKLRINKILAEAFRYKCLDPPRSSIPRMQRRGLTSNNILQLHHPTLQPSSTRLHPSAPPHRQPLQNLVRPSPNLHQNLASPPVQNVQPPPTLAHPHVPSQPTRPPVQNVQPPVHPRVPSPPTKPPVQNVQPHPTLARPHVPPSPPSRPLVIGSFTRPTNVPRVAGEVRARAPHLQSSDRSNGSPSAAITPPVMTSQIRPPPPPPSTTGPSVPEQRMNLDNGGHSTHQSHGSSAFPSIPTVLPSTGSATGNLDGSSNRMPREGGTSVVCLSDDE